MRRLVLLAGISAVASVTALLGACAEDGAASAEDAGGSSNIAPATDGGADAPVVDAEAGPCADCMYFLETCTSDVFCPNGPFDLDDEDAVTAVTQINVIRGRSENDVWIAGALGALAHFDGTSWTVSEPGTKETMRALWLRDSGEVAFGRLENIYTRGIAVEDAGPPSSGGWTIREQPVRPPGYDPSSIRFTAGWAATGSDWLWCATTVQYSPRNGLWRLRLPPSGPPAIDDVLAAGVCSDLPCSQMLAVHGSSADDLWAVGMSGSVIHITGGESDAPLMTAFNSRTWNALHGVWAASSTDAWAVGTQGTIRRYTGDPQLWEIVADVPTVADLHAVWGSSSSDIWAVGEDATVLHYDGTTWSRVKIAGLGARRPKLTTVWTAAPGHVWIGGQGIVLSLGGKP